MKTVGVTAALCALLVFAAGCGGTASSEQADTTVAGAQRERTTPALPPLTPNGESLVLGDNLKIVVSSPKSFTPTGTAYPTAPRAVGFEMTMRNDGTAAYRPTLLALAATTDTASTPQVIDATQGYSGLTDATELLPGATVRFAVAFAVPAGQTLLRVVASPNPATTETVQVFSGTA